MAVEPLRVPHRHCSECGNETTAIGTTGEDGKLGPVVCDSCVRSEWEESDRESRKPAPEPPPPPEPEHEHRHEHEGAEA